MGGKGGGGDAGGGSQYATGNITKGPFNPAGWSDEYTKATADQIYKNDPSENNEYRKQMEANKRNYNNEADWRAAKGGSGFSWSANLFDRWYPEPVAAPAPAAAVPAPAAPAPAEPAPVVPEPVVPEVVPPIGTGNPIEQPTSLGNDLASTVNNFWVGGTDEQGKALNKSKAMTTTQT